jgi:Cytochrome c554 and c-prime
LGARKLPKRGDEMMSKLRVSNNSIRAKLFGLLLPLLLVAVGVMMNGESAQAEAVKFHLDATKVMGPDACGECHKSSVSVWKKTTHARTFKELPRNNDAKKIAKKMGIKRLKSDSQCLNCHFTSQEKEGKTKPIAGITCESCHGEGKDWIKLHSDFGGKDVTKETETAEHRTARWTDASANGMIRPSDLYGVASNCFSCHTVPDEKLVNVGGHTAGSKFDLVAWSQGEVRHNVWYSKSNDEADANRKRMMYVVSSLLDLEYALRGVAKATEKASYAVSMAKRAKRAKKRLKAIAGLIEAPEIDAVLKTAKSAKLKLKNEAKLTAAADKIQTSAKAFSSKYDGSKFAGVDKLIPGSDKYKGKISE